jgi:hypothetical protein
LDRKAEIAQAEQAMEAKDKKMIENMYPKLGIQEYGS